MIYGIDLGTTNSLIAKYDDGMISVLQNSLGESLTPSVVSFSKENVLVGKTAKESMIQNEETFSAFKRFMGTEKQYFANRKWYSPSDLSARVLRYLAESVKQSDEVTEVVISVPAYFNELQRSDTLLAAQEAGLSVRGLVNEPTAAALAYHINESKDDKVVIVIDLGGGTFDVSLLEVFDSIIEVKAVAGDNFFGGEDFDELIENLLCKKYKLNKHLMTPRELGILRNASVQMKYDFDTSENSTREISVSNEMMEVTLTEQEFIYASVDLMGRLAEPIRKVLSDTETDLDEIDEVILVGGSTKMPLVRREIARMFGRDPLCSLNPDEVVAMGAAVYAAMKDQNIDFKETVVTDVCPYTLGIAVSKLLPNGNILHQISPLIERNMTIPISIMHSVVPVHEDQQGGAIKVYQGEKMNPEENLFLGEIHVEYPQNVPYQEKKMDVRFTYDTNGVLEVIVSNDFLNISERAIMLNNRMLSDQEINKRLKEIEEIKIHPLEQEDNLLSLARGEKAYELSLGSTRELISDAIFKFTQCLHKQGPIEIKKAKDELDSITKNILGEYQ